MEFDESQLLNLSSKDTDVISRDQIRVLESLWQRRLTEEEFGEVRGFVAFLTKRHPHLAILALKKARRLERIQKEVGDSLWRTFWEAWRNSRDCLLETQLTNIRRDTNTNPLPKDTTLSSFSMGFSSFILTKDMDCAEQVKVKITHRFRSEKKVPQLMELVRVIVDYSRAQTLISCIRQDYFDAQS